MTCTHRVFVLPIVLGLLAGWVAAADAPPTVADVRQLFADGKYTDVIKVVSKLTATRDWQAKKPQGYELYTLKAEAHLHLKESALAAASFDLAAKTATEQLVLEKAALDKAAAIAAKAPATAPAAPDEVLLAKWNADRQAAGVARATAYLVKHSIGTNYVPKATANQRVAGGTPEDHMKLDIVNPDTRKQALAALWTDEKNASAAKFAAASDTDNKSMQAVLDAAPAVGPLRDFDFAANGNDDETRKLAADIAGHGRDLLQGILDKMTTRLDVISTDALNVETQHIQLQGGAYVDRYRKHGMEGKQPGELQEMGNNAQEIGRAIKTLADQLGTERDFFDKPSQDVKRIKDGAEKVLKADYTQTYATMDAARKS